MDTITVSLTPDGDFFVSHCLEYDIASQGRSSEEALDNIAEAVSLFLEVASPDEIERRLALNLERGQFNQESLPGFG